MIINYAMIFYIKDEKICDSKIISIIRQYLIVLLFNGLFSVMRVPFVELSVALA